MQIENLQVWQKARILNTKVYQLCERFPLKEKYNLTDQLIRASSSVVANIAEGFGRYNLQERIQFLRISRGSLYEVKSHLYLSMDAKYITEVELDSILVLIEEIAKMLNSLISKTNEFKERKELK